MYTNLFFKNELLQTSHQMFLPKINSTNSINLRETTLVIDDFGVFRMISLGYFRNGFAPDEGWVQFSEPLTLYALLCWKDLFVHGQPRTFHRNVAIKKYYPEIGKSHDDCWAFFLCLVVFQDIAVINKMDIHSYHKYFSIMFFHISHEFLFEVERFWLKKLGILKNLLDL